MAFKVINNPEFNKFKNRTGFKNYEFKQLAGLYSRGSSAKVLYDMAVDVDFEKKTCMVTYFQSATRHPFLQFIISQPGPNTLMYEVYKQDKGRIAKSGLFERAFEKLESEISELIDNA